MLPFHVRLSSNWGMADLRLLVPRVSQLRRRPNQRCFGRDSRDWVLLGRREASRPQAPSALLRDQEEYELLLPLRRWGSPCRS